MHDEFLSLTKALNVPLLHADEIVIIRELQKEWEHWAKRERQHAAARIAAEQKAAFNSFLDNPTAEAEHKLIITADANLTGTRYALLRKAFAELRGRISAQAARIIAPTIDRALDALHAEHSRRRAAAEPVMSSKDRNPVVVESQRALDFAEKLLMRVHRAKSGTGDTPPLELADVLMSGAKDLTP